MRLFILASLVTLLASLVIAMEPDSTPAAPKPPGENNDWLRFITARKKTMTRVTDQPLSMDIQIAGLCRLPLPTELPEANPHRGHYVHVYVTPASEELIRMGKGTYPVGTLIVKEKIPNTLTLLGRPENEHRAIEIKTGKDRLPELFTVMLKREAGYNKECGDWEFMVVSGDAQQILARGKLDSCIECHQQYKHTDYVTRLYPAK
jgi:hypothetical protein